MAYVNVYVTYLLISAIKKIEVEQQRRNLIDFFDLRRVILLNRIFKFIEVLWIICKHDKADIFGIDCDIFANSNNYRKW